MVSSCPCKGTGTNGARHRRTDVNRTRCATRCQTRSGQPSCADRVHRRRARRGRYGTRASSGRGRVSPAGDRSVDRTGWHGDKRRSSQFLYSECPVSRRRPPLRRQWDFISCRAGASASLVQDRGWSAPEGACRPSRSGRVGPARRASPASDTRWRLSPLALPLGGRAVSVRAFGWSSAAPWAPFGALVGRVTGWLLACGSGVRVDLLAGFQEPQQPCDRRQPTLDGARRQPCLTVNQAHHFTVTELRDDEAQHVRPRHLDPRQPRETPGGLQAYEAECAHVRMREPGRRPARYCSRPTPLMADERYLRVPPGPLVIRWVLPMGGRRCQRSRSSMTSSPCLRSQRRFVGAHRLSCGHWSPTL